MFAAVKACLVEAKERLETRIVHFSVQVDHIHLIVETRDRDWLSRAMTGLQVRIARVINKLLGRKGQVFNDRYHASKLSNPPKLRNALRYVLQNAAHHSQIQPGQIDSCSSGQWFDGWKDIKPKPQGPSPVAQAMSFALRILWKQQTRLISIYEVPK